jgi:hypothetical protein
LHGGAGEEVGGGGGTAGVVGTAGASETAGMAGMAGMAAGAAGGLAAGMAPRLCLHACALEFTHPATGQAVRIISPAPF